MSQRAPISPTRRTKRFVPQRPVTVAISNEGSFTYGVVANISEGGACFQTNAVPRNRSLDLVLSFYDGEYVRTTGRLVWSQPGDGLATVGVEFTGLTEQGRVSLRSSLGSGAFAPL
jgi:hypothetical protein